MHKYWIACLLVLLLWALPVAPVYAELMQMAPVPAQLSQTRQPTESDYWLNSTYALGGSAAGHGVVVLTVVLLDILPAVFAAEGQAPDDWIGAAGPLLALLLLVPMISTPLMMHIFSPKTEWEYVLWSTVGAVLSVILHALLMVPLFLFFAEDSASFAQTFYLLAPAAISSALVVEALGTAWFHHLGASGWQLAPTPAGGVQLSHQLRF